MFVFLYVTSTVSYGVISDYLNIVVYTTILTLFTNTPKEKKMNTLHME